MKVKNQKNKRREDNSVCQRTFHLLDDFKYTNVSNPLPITNDKGFFAKSYIIICSARFPFFIEFTIYVHIIS